MDRRLLILFAAVAAPAAAADQPPPRITVTGVASVATPPDIATVAYAVHGEGETSDDALRVLASKRRAIDAGLATLAGATPPKGGDVSIREVRSRDCTQNSYGPPQLSTGACAIIGYTADLPLQFRTTTVRDAGTMAGLIGRLGGTNPHVQSFMLANEAPAKTRATAAALADARQKAEAIAAGAGVRLGPLLSASDGSERMQSDDITVTGSRVYAVSAPPPPAPVPVEVTPEPIQSQARITVTYQIAS